MARLRVTPGKSSLLGTKLLSFRRSLHLHPRRPAGCRAAALNLFGTQNTPGNPRPAQNWNYSISLKSRQRPRVASLKTGLRGFPHEVGNVGTEARKRQVAASTIAIATRTRQQDSSIVKTSAFHEDSPSLNHSLPTVSRRKDGRNEGSKIDNAVASYWIIEYSELHIQWAPSGASRYFFREIINATENLREQI